MKLISTVSTTTITPLEQSQLWYKLQLYDHKNDTPVETKERASGGKELHVTITMIPSGTTLLHMDLRKPGLIMKFSRSDVSACPGSRDRDRHTDVSLLTRCFYVTSTRDKRRDENRKREDRKI